MKLKNKKSKVGESVRHALITAGSKGLGRMVTEEFLKKGFSVTVNFRQDKRAVQSIKEQWSHAADRLQFIQGDITQPEDTENLVQEAINR